MPDTPTRLKVFVSHSSTDKAVCDQVVGALRGAGADVWYDEHNLGAGVLRREIMKELAERPVALVMLSKAAFASDWVQDECEWAYNLYKREPNRMLLPVVVGAYEPRDFNSLLYLESMKRVEGPGNSPYPVTEMIARTLTLLTLTPAGQRPVVATPQPTESLADLLTQGKALQAQQKHADALSFFERATQADPNNFSAWFNLGYTLFQLKRWAEALPADERATTLDPTSALAWGNKGLALASLKRYEEALAAYDKALALDPQLAPAWRNKGTALGHLERDEEALIAYNRALTLDPNDALVWFNKGITLNNLKRDAEALAAYDQLLALDPNNANAWNNKGWALNNLKRYAEALAAYDHALALGETALRWKNKAIALRALGRKVEAEKAERRANELGG
jgi:tetratricopeptide (TPR) repeat protein